MKHLDVKTRLRDSDGMHEILYKKKSDLEETVENEHLI